MSNNKYYIAIDCSSGNPRPDNILSNVLLETKLKSNNFTVKSKSFGEWTFVLNDDCNPQDFIDSLSNIKLILNKFYKSRQIRYAEWYEE